MTRGSESQGAPQLARAGELCEACGHAAGEHDGGRQCYGVTLFGGCVCVREHVVRTGQGAAACSCGWEFRAPVPRRELSPREVRAAFSAASVARNRHRTVVALSVGDLVAGGV